MMEDNMEMSKTLLQHFQNHPYRQQIGIVLLLTIAFLVRCAFFSGGICSVDATAYARHAYEIASGQYNLDAIQTFYGFRYFVLLPTALSFILFGINDIAVSIFPYIFSILNILVVFFIADKAFNRPIAWLSAILLIFYPMNIMITNVLGPDSFIPLLSSLAIFCHIKADETGSSRFQRKIWLILCGIFIALAYTSRVTSIFIFASLALFQIFHKKYSFLVWMILGLSIPLVSESLFFYTQTGDPFFEISRITGASVANTIRDDCDLSLTFYPKAMLGFDLTGLAYFGLTWWIVAAGLILAWMKKDARMQFMAICLIIPFLGFEFGFQSIKEGILIVKNYNYLSLIECPAMIICAYFLYHLFHALRYDMKTKVSIFLTIILILISMNSYGMYRLYLNIRNDVIPYTVVADYFKKQPGGIIYTHHFLWPAFLAYFLKYDTSYIFRDLNKATESDLNDLSNVYVILNQRYLQADIIGRAHSRESFLKNYIKSPPHRWIKALSFSGKPSYNSVTLFYIPEEIKQSKPYRVSSP